MSPHHTTEQLVATVAESSSSSFYRDRWASIKDFSKLPTISRADFLAVPLSKRRYKDEKALVKIVHTSEGPFLSEWSFDDIALEPLGDIGQRPLVFLSDPHEAVEKSMWCYEQNKLPLIAEKDPDITMYAAEKYKIDTLITDVVSLQKMLPYLRSHEPLFSIIILGEAFEIEPLLSMASYAVQVRLVLRLPETGVVGWAPLTANAALTPVTGCLVEHDEGTIVTKLSMLVTPIIRYRMDPALRMPAFNA